VSKMQRLAFLILGLLIGLGSYASAGSIHRTTGYITASASGVIALDGKIVEGQDFTVTHPERGKYIITFEDGYFSRVDCAALIVEGVHRSLLSHVEPHCGSSAVWFGVHIFDPNGVAADHDFGFIAVAMQPSY
jgi:hypothetical protein